MLLWVLSQKILQYLWPISPTQNYTNSSKQLQPVHDIQLAHLRVEILCVNFSQRKMKGPVQTL